METDPCLYTVGYSTHEWHLFLDLLRSTKITAIADVRSHPTARLPSYRQENLAPALQCEGIAYVFLGRELGARREEPECFVEGQAVYERVAQLPAFQEGIARLERGASRHRIALLCAEREPLDCHRGVLISRVLCVSGWRIRHLLNDGQVEEHTETERRLIDLVGVDPLLDGDLPHAELLVRAYAERGRELAWRLPSEASRP